LKKAKFLEPFEDVISKLDAEGREIASSFRYNLDAVITVISIPLSIAQTHYDVSRLNELLTMESIKRAKWEEEIVNDPKKEEKDLQKKKEIVAAAIKGFNEELETKQGVRKAWQGTYHFLDTLIGHRRIDDAPQELIRQGIVLAWSTFESFFRDHFSHYVNKNPEASKEIFNNPKLKNRCNVKVMSLDVLSEYDFDVSGAMGTILSSYFDFSNLDTIREICKTLFPDNEKLIREIEKDEFWLLNQRRHLIVHRSGIVNKQYLKRTSDKKTLGTRIPVGPEEIRADLTCVRDLGIRLLKSLGS